MNKEQYQKISNDYGYLAEAEADRIISKIDKELFRITKKSTIKKIIVMNIESLHVKILGIADTVSAGNMTRKQGEENIQDHLLLVASIIFEIENQVIDGEITHLESIKVIQTKNILSNYCFDVVQAMSTEGIRRNGK